MKQRKEKNKTPLVYRGKKHDTYLLHVKVQMTSSKKDIYLVLVYGITVHPLIFATNIEIYSKEDVINVTKHTSPDGALRNISAVKSRCSGSKVSVYKKSPPLTH